MTVPKPKIGVGIHYRVEKLTPEVFTHWAFDNIGEVQTNVPDIIISGDHTRGVFFSFAPNLHKLRIGVFGVYTHESAGEAIDTWAIRLVRDCQVELETIEHDLFEEGKGKIGHWNYPPGAPKVQEIPVTSGVSKLTGVKPRDN